jgi:PHD/YefM family antitoxin component YafN of YafNO toxin-antitoxin module
MNRDLTWTFYMSIMDMTKCPALENPMNWSVAHAKQRLSELIRRARTEPQLVFRRKELVAVVVNPAAWDQLREDEARSQRTLGAAAAEVRQILVEEGYELEVPERRDRPNAFSADV